MSILFSLIYGLNVVPRKIQAIICVKKNKTVTKMYIEMPSDSRHIHGSGQEMEDGYSDFFN